MRRAQPAHDEPVLGGQHRPARPRDRQRTVVNAIVRVEERYDYLAQIELERGYSSYNGLFGSLTATDNNIAGRGIRCSCSGHATASKLKDARARRCASRSGCSAPVRSRPTSPAATPQQDTPRFGMLTTEGFTAGLHPPVDHAALGERRAAHASRSACTTTSACAAATSMRCGRSAPTWTTARSRSRRDRPVGAARSCGTTGSIAAASCRRSRRRTASGSRPGRVRRRPPARPGRVLQGLGRRLEVLPIGSNLALRGDAPLRPGHPARRRRRCCPRSSGSSPAAIRPCAATRTTGSRPRSCRSACPRSPGVTQIRVIPAGGNIRAARQPRRPAPHLQDPRRCGVQRRRPDHEPVGLGHARRHPALGRHRPARCLTPFGILALEYAVPLRPQLGDDPRGRIHFYFAAQRPVLIQAAPYGTRRQSSHLEDAPQEAPDQAQGAHQAPDRDGEGGQEAGRRPPKKK